MDLHLSPTEAKLSQKESNFPVGAANRQLSVITQKFVALYHRNTKIRMHTDKCDDKIM